MGIHHFMQSRLKNLPLLINFVGTGRIYIYIIESGHFPLS